jgi:hypothetical protein
LTFQFTVAQKKKLQIVPLKSEKQAVMNLADQAQHMGQSTLHTFQSCAVAHEHIRSCFFFPADVKTAPATPAPRTTTCQERTLAVSTTARPPATPSHTPTAPRHHPPRKCQTTSRLPRLQASSSGSSDSSRTPPG